MKRSPVLLLVCSLPLLAQDLPPTPAAPASPVPAGVRSAAPGAPAAPAMPALPAAPGAPAAPPAAVIPAPPAMQAPTENESGDELGLKALTPDKRFLPQYRNSSVDLMLQEISLLTGRTLLRDPGLPAVSVTLESRAEMSHQDFLIAAESLLAMNNIALVPFRNNFIKVVPKDAVARSGVELSLDLDLPQVEEDAVISQLVQLKHLELAEVQALITERLSPTAKLQPVERSNAFLLTDNRNNIKRVLDILNLIDRPADVREEVRIYEIRHAVASEVKSRLEELIQESQQNQSARPRTPTIRTQPGNGNNRNIIRATVTQQSNEAGPSPGLIRGQVQIVADERTNLLLIISRPENDTFFEDMISTLDREMDPEITVRIYNLQFADAEEASTTLNELIGAASENNNETPNNPNADPAAPGDRGQSIRDFLNNRSATNQNTSSSTNPTETGGGSIGQIAENTRILADLRTNSLILMGRNSDLDVLEGVIAQLDIMLAQVLVRAVIMEVNLNDQLAYGIDWLQRSLIVNDVNNINGTDIREPVFSFGGAQNLSPTSTEFRDGANVGRDIDFSPGALSYFATLYDFNLDAVLRLAQSNSDVKVVATPIILTTDNTEASIVVGERRAIPTTTATTIGGSIQSSFEYENIGLDLLVTPRINPQGIVIMEVEQSAENVGGTTVIDGNEVPIITTRQLNASVAIRDGGTLVLGGLVREDERESQTKVPFLGNIPIFGHLFRSKSTENVRTELLVLLSPEVLMSTEEAEKLTEQLKEATELGDNTWYRGWHPDKDVDAERKPKKPDWMR